MLIYTIISVSGWRQYLGEAALRSAAARELVPAAHGDGPDGHGRERDMATGPAKECVC